MRYTWEIQDIIPGRRMSSHNRAEGYVVIYSVGTGPKRYGVASLSDGMLWLNPCYTLEEVAEHLNKVGMVPDNVDDNDDRRKVC